MIFIKQEKYNEIFENFSKNGYKLLTPFDKKRTTDDIFEYICLKHSDKGIQKMSYRQYHRGRRCAFCSLESGKRFHKIPNIILKDMVEQRGWTYVKSFYSKEEEKTKIVFVCNKHKDFGEQIINLCDLQLGKNSCCKCNGTNRTLEEFQEMVFKKSPNIVVHSFKNMKNRASCECRVCGTKWEPFAYNLVSTNNTGCPECGKQTTGKKKWLSQKEIRKRLDNMLYITPLTIPNTSKDLVRCKCDICGSIWDATFFNLTKPKNPTNCPYCKMSNSEKIIRKYLEQNNIVFEYQKKFEGCKNIFELPFDFYLPEYNMCIEYDGEYHYKNNVCGRENDVFIVKKRDSIKTQFCKDNNIYLLRIPYWEKDNIDEILNKKIMINN